MYDKVYVKQITRARDAAIDQIFQVFPDGIGLETGSVVELQSCGLTERQAEALHASFCIGRQSVRYRERVGSPTCAERYLRNKDVFDHKVERFVVVSLDARQRAIGHEIVGLGTVNHVEVHPREVFLSAIRRRATSIVLAHNHPSCDPEPSDSDLELTRRLYEAGVLLGIPVVDHVILTAHDYCSLAQRGFL